MPLVDTKKMFEMAYKNGYAIGAFNVNNMEITQGIVNAIAEEKAPLILQISRGARSYASMSYLKAIINVAVEENPDIPICMHLDHGDTFESCKQCVDDGFTSVMIDASHSSVRFSVRHIVSRTAGKFRDFSGSIVYDAEHPSKSSVKATIKMASIDTDNDRRDGHVKSADFFNVEKYPEMTFVSSSTKAKGNMLMVTGDLTMHGVTRKVVLPVEVLGVGIHPMTKASVAGFQADLTVKRSDFGVNSWTDVAGVLGDEVKVTLLVEALASSGKMMGENPCNPCGNACNPCAEKNPCAKKNACNPCGK